MKTLECRGSSDDTFGVYTVHPDGLRGPDHDDCADFSVRTFEIDAGVEGRLWVVGVYGKCPVGVWAVGLAPVEEDAPWPTWAQPRWSLDGYTPVMRLEVPDHATVQLVGVEGKRPPVE